MSLVYWCLVEMSLVCWSLVEMSLVWSEMSLVCWCLVEMSLVWSEMLLVCWCLVEMSLFCLLMFGRDVTCLLMFGRDVTCLLMFGRNVTCLLMFGRDVTCLLMFGRDVTCLLILVEMSLVCWCVWQRMTWSTGWTRRHAPSHASSGTSAIARPSSEMASAERSRWLWTGLQVCSVHSRCVVPCVTVSNSSRSCVTLAFLTVACAWPWLFSRSLLHGVGFLIIFFLTLLDT